MRKSTYAGKMTQPISITITPRTLTLAKRLMRKLGLTRSDLFERGLRTLAVEHGLLRSAD